MCSCSDLLEENAERERERKREREREREGEGEGERERGGVNGGGKPRQWSLGHLLQGPHLVRSDEVAVARKGSQLGI